MSGHEPDPRAVAQQAVMRAIGKSAEDGSLNGPMREQILKWLETPIGPGTTWLEPSQETMHRALRSLTKADKQTLREDLGVFDKEVPVKAFWEEGRDGRDEPLSPFNLADRFPSLARPYAKNEAKELVTYWEGAWVVDDDWLRRSIVRGLGPAWTAERSNSYMRVLNDSAQPVGLGKEEYLNFQNCLVHWRTGNRVEHSPADCGTIQLGTVWDPDAKCPRWLEFLSTAVALDAAGFLQEVFGYCLYMGGNPFRASFMLHGPSGSGKSVALNKLSELIGKSNLANRTLQELGEDRFATADLFGTLLNVCGDIDSTVLRETAMFKRITGGDTIRGENKGTKAFFFNPICKLIFSANNLPGSVDVTTAWFTRWHLISFPNGGHSATPGFEEGLRDELPGIAVWAVAGLQRLMARGMFDPPESVKASGEDYRRKIDSVAGWFGEQQTYTTGTPATGNDLYLSYLSYCEDEGNDFPVKRANFYSRLDELTPRVKWSGKQAYYRICASGAGSAGTTFTY